MLGSTLVQVEKVINQSHLVEGKSTENYSLFYNSLFWIQKLQKTFFWLQPKKTPP